jgi:hypothetical protein
MKRDFFFISAFLSFGFATIAVAQGPKLPSATASPIPSPAASPAKQSTRPLPFHGMVSQVDQKAKTFGIHGKDKPHVFKITDKTIIMKGAGNATIKDIVENEEVSGSYWKSPDGSLEAKFVKLGPMKKPTAPSPSATPKS